MRTRLPLILAVLLVMALAGPAPALMPELKPSETGTPVELLDLSADVIQSDNVTYHGTIPIDSPGVGGAVVEREDGRYFVVTGLKGLSIYDISDPALPALVSTFPFPHSQNEDVNVSQDGTRAIIAADGSLALPVNPVTTGVHVIDISDVAAPALLASSSQLVRGEGTGRGAGEHTSECALADCSVIYGSSGRIYEVDEEAGVVADTGQVWNEYIDPATGESGTSGGRHALDLDESGLLVADSTPRLVLDPQGQFVDGATPTSPGVVAVGPRPDEDSRLQHNNRRPDATQWTPRPADDVVETTTVGERTRSISIVDERPVMGPGELLIANSESNLNPGCANAGGLSTWSMVNFDRGQQLQPLEVFKPLSGTYLDGSPAVNGLGCSGHWFDVSGDITAASWYEHGVHFFDIDRQTGTIDEVGYFQPVVTEAGSARWVDDEFIYSVDYARGIDILSFDREGDTPSQSELDSAWIANLGVVSTGAQTERYICQLGASN